MDKGQKKVLASLAIVLSLILIGLLVFLLARDPALGEFVPPAFEANAKTEFSEPIDQKAAYTSFSIPNEFTGALCANVYVQDGEAEVYFTSFAQNAVWAKVIIYDQKGKMLGESGLLRPGEYIDTVKLSKAPKENTKISVKVLLYEPDTYYSHGTCSLNVNLIVK